MKCEFSERNYEKSLDFELSNGNPFFSPNQIQENVLGIDSSTITDNTDFWRLWNPDWFISPSVPIGVEISQNLWHWRRGIGHIRHFPRIRANVFLQYKIPEYITSTNGREYSIWRDSYFRYNVITHQNIALRILERNVSQNAIVVYASPAFWTYDQLIDHCIQRTLISNSNFVKPSILQNHHRYSYTSSGLFGWRHSKPSKSDKINLKNEINNLVHHSKEKETFVTLKQLSSDIDKTVNDIDKLMEKDNIHTEEIDTQFKEKFLKTKNYFLEMNDIADDDSKYLLNILAFTFQTNISWFIVS